MLDEAARVVQMLSRIDRRVMGNILKPVFGFHTVEIFFIFDYGYG